MGELTDKGKGTIKETIGKVAGDRDLEAEGKFDKLKGTVKGKFEEVKNDLKKSIRPEEDDKY